MILSALACYYDQLLDEGRIPKPGWNPRRVSFTIVLSENGELLDAIPSADKRGTEVVVPEQAKRTVAIAPNFLCDTPSYFLGIVDTKGKTERDKARAIQRASDCFKASRELHHKFLDGVDSSPARAILNFYDAWDPGKASVNPVLQRSWDALLAGGMFTYSVVGSDGFPIRAIDDIAIREAWDRRVSEESDDDPVMTCLVTGCHGPIARLHPSIKGVIGAQSSGATLVGFNAPAFESYGHVLDLGQGQGFNAPVNARVARAYGAALNYLLSQDDHRIRFGDTTVVFWSEHKDQGNSALFANMLGGMVAGRGDSESADKQISAVMKALSVGRHVSLDGIDLTARFFVLGLAPNASRLSVRFFLQDGFGEMLRHVSEHYDRLSICHGPNNRDHVTPYFLLRSIENEKATKPVASSILVGGLFQAILEGGRYPEALYSNALLRIRATRDVTYERASIIKAFLLRNRNYSEEGLGMDLNESNEELAYSLGRAFAVLEQIQKRANGVTTVASKYLDSASTTPALVFPVLLRLSDKHLAKIERDAAGLARYFSRALSELLSRGGEPRSFPKRLSMDEQGSFLLGYYQQKWKAGKSTDVSADQNDVTQEA